MTNKDFFAEYGTVTWAIEENLDYFLMQYWEEVVKKYGHKKNR